MAFDGDIHTVGHHLQTYAHSFGGVERDAYARSAFNRYYYCVFLKTRDLFKSLDPSWSRMPHAGFPSVLKGEVRKQLKKGWTRARKNSDNKLMRDTETALRAVEALSGLLETAYAIRVVADYEPEETVEFNGVDRFSLKEVEITSAHGWRSKCEIFCDEIQSAWLQLNV
ncbi:hypothetical protein GFK91_10745 [Roseibium aggregatum]|uniref:hypothetical protein n=1 Tax=Roseibium aggregatum TaxID=187304 RepID=UPI001E63954F|nr:hypothetical protein [Roseibium aggregatum]UES56043.1 hypothetical protein GFK91_10745 [Roseibium aggregatum]